MQGHLLEFTWCLEAAHAILEDSSKRFSNAHRLNLIRIRSEENGERDGKQATASTYKKREKATELVAFFLALSYLCAIYAGKYCRAVATNG